ncbi:MAG: nucleotidyltransferase domain-containing protein [Acidobacteria bacterium]|nr:nucleotidyltransferase domain-containing protein [Acidobacteriota bacterium]
MSNWQFDDLDRGHPAVIFKTVTGSHLYGTQGPESDRDERGLFVVPADHYLRLDEVPAQVSDDRGDRVFYSLRRFFELAAMANPNILELLFVPDECVLVNTCYMTEISRHRMAFLSKRVFDSYVAYAHTQIKKARGRNKWINNPWPEQPPCLLDYCWFLPNPTNAEPRYRPVSFHESGLNPSELAAVKVNHSPFVYRVYLLGGPGLVADGAIRSRSVAREDEHRCIGLLTVNEERFAQAKRDHKNYWQWRDARNEARWRDQEQGVLDYDAKNMMHTFRLLFSAKKLLTEGEPKTRFSGADLDYLLSIRRGDFSYDLLIERAAKLTEELETLTDCAPLPESPDLPLINQLLCDVTQQWERDHA